MFLVHLPYNKTKQNCLPSEAISHTDVYLDICSKSLKEVQFGFQGNAFKLQYIWALQIIFNK